MVEFHVYLERANVYLFGAATNTFAASHIRFSGQSMCVACRVPRCFLLFGSGGAHLPRFRLSRGFPFSVRPKQRIFFCSHYRLHVQQIVKLPISFFSLLLACVRCIRIHFGECAQSVAALRRFVLN